MRERVISLLAAVCLLAGAAAAFSDVEQGDWFCQDVEFVLERGIMNGMSDETFAPAAPVSRAMVVTVLHRMEKSPEIEEDILFPDVPERQWYSDAAAWAKSAGIALGYDSGLFGPDDAVTREQLAVFLWRYATVKELEIAQGVLSGYVDAESISDWALDGMKHAAGVGLMTGKEGDRLDPAGTATRAELAAILHRVMIPAAG